MACSTFKVFVDDILYKTFSFAAADCVTTSFAWAKEAKTTGPDDCSRVSLRQIVQQPAKLTISFPEYGIEIDQTVLGLKLYY